MAIENILSDARSVVTVISLFTFVCIVLWSYSSRRAADFSEAARLPFADDEAAAANESKMASTEKHDG